VAACVYGTACGLALLTKYSAVLLIPMLILLALAEAWLETNDKKEAAARTWRNFKAAAAILVIAAAPIWCAYGMRYSGGTREFEEQRASTESAMCGSPRCYAPPSFAEGLPPRLHRSARPGRYYGDGSYFLGRPYLQAPWYWFPVTMTIKFTLAFLAMLAMGAAEFLAVGRKWRREILFLLLPPVLYLAASMSIQRTGVGIWHLFPMFPFLVIAAAAGCVSLARRYHWVGGILVCLLVLHAASSLRAYPNYLSYANEAWEGRGISTSTCPGPISIRRTGRSAGTWSSIPIHHAG